MKDLSKYFENEIKIVSIEFFYAKIKPRYFLPSVFFLFIMCLPRNSIPCYTSTIPSMLEEFRPVSA